SLLRTPPISTLFPYTTLFRSDLDGAIVSQNFTVTVAASPPRIADISTRAQVSSGDNVLIGGFIIQGSASNRVLVRAIGPSLIPRSEEHTSELQSLRHLVCRLL